MILAAFGGVLSCASSAGSKGPADESAGDSVPRNERKRPEKKPSPAAKKKSGSRLKKATTFGGDGGPTVRPKAK
jgi:hypothetical protein